MGLRVTLRVKRWSKEESVKTSSFQLVRSVLFLLVTPIVSVPLLAQQSGLPTTERASSKTPEHAVAAAGRADKFDLQDLQQRCAELLRPIEGFKHMHTFERRAEADKIWDSLFASKSDVDLNRAEIEFRDCVVELPQLALRRDAFQAYRAIVDEQESRRVAEAQVQDAGELKKQHDDFLEAAKFAAALYKENEQRKEQNAKLVAVANDLLEPYRTAYNLAHEAVNLVEQSISGTSGLSLPPFVYTPPPQIIRIETPAVPRALHCMANTTSAPLLPQGSSTTWVNCW